MDTATANPLLDWALYLAAMGWPVFPLRPLTKRQPAVKDWENRATTAPTRIRRCWTTDRYNIGLATGPAGLVAVDLDTVTDGETGPDGETALAALAAERGGPLPDTYTVTTPSGGRHLYYQCPPGVQLRNTAQHICPNVDTRAGGGYVVGPGSVTAEGAYELVDDRDPVELPGWILQALCARPAPGESAPHRMPVQRPDAYGTAALRGECDRVRTAPPGRHNAILSRGAWRIGQLIAAGVLDHAHARAELTQAAHHLVTAACDCTPAEVARVIDAGIAKGRTQPRHTTTNSERAA